MAFSMSILVMFLLILILPLSIVGLILSIIRMRKKSDNKGGAITGLVFSIIGLFISLIIIALIFFVFLINTGM